jgi:hypothetical protein
VSSDISKRITCTPSIWWLFLQACGQLGCSHRCLCSLEKRCMLWSGQTKEISRRPLDWRKIIGFLEDWVPKEIFLQRSFGSCKSKGKISHESIPMPLFRRKIRKSGHLLEKFQARNRALPHAALSPTRTNDLSSYTLLLYSPAQTKRPRLQIIKTVTHRLVRSSQSFPS